MKKTSVAKNEIKGQSFLMSLPIFCDDSEMTIEVLDVLYEVDSLFQKILIVNTKEFGKALIIDGVLQSAESDHNVYDYALLAPLKKTDQNVLILGGGDGYIAETALSMNPNLSISIVDLDSEVVRGVQTALKQEIFSDPRVKLIIGEAIHHLHADQNTYDGVVCDLTDTPVGTNKERREFEIFFNKIVTHAKQKLRVGGWISIQSGATIATRNFIDEATIIEQILSDNFSEITKSNVFIPSYGESCSFLSAVNIK